MLDGSTSSSELLSIGKDKLEPSSMGELLAPSSPTPSLDGKAGTEELSGGTTLDETSLGAEDDALDAAGSGTTTISTNSYCAET